MQKKSKCTATEKKFSTIYLLFLTNSFKILMEELYLWKDNQLQYFNTEFNDRKNDNDALMRWWT